MAGKVSSPQLSSLASRVLSGYEPSRDEVNSLAASVLAQAEPDGAEAGADQASQEIPEPPAPGPADIVTVTVSKDGYSETIERDVVTDHPELVKEAEGILDAGG